MLNWMEPAEVREILGLGWAQQTPMAAPCPVVLTLGGAWVSWTEPAGVLESTCEESPLEGTCEESALEGTGEELALEGTGEEPALEGTGEEWPQEGASEEPALAGIGEERPQGGAGEKRDLGLSSNSSPHMPPTSPGAHEHR